MHTKSILKSLASTASHRLVSKGLQIIALAAITVVPRAVHSAEARFTLEQIIEGIEKNEALWRKTNWMIRYHHTRDRRAVPPGVSLVPFAPREIVNARKGNWLYSQLGPTNNASENVQQWVLWKDNVSTIKDSNSAFIRSEPDTMVFSSFYYPFALHRNLLTGAVPFPKEAYDDPEFAIMLPYALKQKSKGYVVQRQLIDIEGVLCHAVELPGKDLIFIDTDHGFVVRGRIVFQGGKTHMDFHASGFKERHPGIWIPDVQKGIEYNLDSDPPEFRGKARNVTINRLIEAKFGTIPDSQFEVPLPKEVNVNDLRKGKN